METKSAARSLLTRLGHFRHNVATLAVVIAMVTVSVVASASYLRGSPHQSLHNSNQSLQFVSSERFSNVTSNVVAQCRDSVTPTYHKCGQLKVCKIAGLGVAANQVVTFTAAPGGAFTVVAGSCTIVNYLYPVNSLVTVTEVAPAADVVQSIMTTPSSDTISLPAKTDTFRMASSWNEVTYTDTTYKVGYFEICKDAKPLKGFPTPSFKFTWGTPVQSVTVLAGTCSPMESAMTGNVVVTELPNAPYHMVGVSAKPAARLVAVVLGAGTFTLAIQTGGIANEVVAKVVNSI